MHKKTMVMFSQDGKDVLLLESHTIGLDIIEAVEEICTRDSINIEKPLTFTVYSSTIQDDKKTLLQGTFQPSHLKLLTN